MCEHTSCLLKDRDQQLEGRIIQAAGAGCMKESQVSLQICGDLCSLVSESLGLVLPLQCLMLTSPCC